MLAEAPAVEARGLSRSQRSGGEVLHILDDLTFVLAPGEVVAITGPSGSGKSTLLYLLGGLDEPDAGQVLISGVDWRILRGPQRAEFRSRSCGFIAQGLTLLPQATASENVEVPLLLAGVERAGRQRLVEEALVRVGLEGEAGKLPDQLSGGQQQRVAIARALVNQPAVVLADEPTASLDSATAQAVVRVLMAAAAETRAAVVLVTHDPLVACHAERVMVVKAGRLEAAPDQRGDV